MSEVVINIYALIDPNTKSVRYIGKTVQMLKNRLKGHISLSKKSKKTSFKERWILKLLSNNQKPIIELIEVANEENWAEREKHWIAFYRNRSVSLTNATDGGDGVHGRKNSEDQKRKNSLRTKGKRLREYTPWTPEQREAIMAGRLKNGQWNKGLTGLFKHTDEWKRQASERTKGDKHPLVKISDSEILIARSRYLSGEKAVALALEYNLVYSHMLRILSNKTRKICAHL